MVEPSPLLTKLVNSQGVRPFDLSTLLNHFLVSASAPGRVDCGNTLDVKPLALTYESCCPTTVNIAINIRTNVSLRPYFQGRVCVDSDSFGTKECENGEISFNGPLGPIFAVISHFGISGVKVEISSDIPPRSGLGGSAAVNVALIGAISKILAILGQKKMLSRKEMALLAYNLEDRTHMTGLQDQLAAVYGGTNQWVWVFSNSNHPFKRVSLLGKDFQLDLANRILIAYTGDEHDSACMITKWVQRFLDGCDRQSWKKIIKVTTEFANALRNKQWETAVLKLTEENKLRTDLDPNVLTPLAKKLIDSASVYRCGGRFTGSGGGGCVWALGEEESIINLKEKWAEILNKSKKGRLLPSTLDNKGIIINYK